MAFLLIFLSVYPQTKAISVHTPCSDVALFDEALQAAIQIPRDDPREYMVGEIAEAEASAGEFGRALKTASLVHHYPEQLYSKIAEAQARHGDFPAARKIIREHVTTAYRASALKEIATIQFESGDVRGALQQASSLGATDDFLDAIGHQQVERGDIDGALQTVKKINNDGEIPDLLWDIAMAEAKRGNLEGAQRLRKRLGDSEMAQTFPLNLVEARIEVGDYDGAVRLARHLSVPERGQVLLDCAESLLKSSRQKEAREMLAQSMDLAVRATDREWAAEHLADVAALQIRNHLDADAETTLDALRGRKAPSGWCKIASAAAEARSRRWIDRSFKDGDMECTLQAAGLFLATTEGPHVVLNRLRTEPNPHDQSSIAVQIATSAAKAGNLRLASVFVDEALKDKEDDVGEGYAVTALRAIGNTMARANAKSAQQWAEHLESAYQRASALVGAAEARCGSTVSPAANDAGAGLSATLKECISVVGGRRRPEQPGQEEETSHRNVRLQGAEAH